MEAMVAEVKAAIESVETWQSEDSGDNRFEFRTAESCGWKVRIVFSGRRQDGTASKGGIVLHLTTELAALARKRAEAL